MNSEQIERLVRELMQTGEILATKGYQLALKQVYVMAVHEVLWAVLLLVVFYLSLRAIRHGYALKENSYHSLWEMWVTFGWLFAGASAVILPTRIGTAIGYLMNPEWYAVKLLAETFLK